MKSTWSRMSAYLMLCMQGIPEIFETIDQDCVCYEKSPRDSNPLPKAECSSERGDQFHEDRVNEK